MLKANPTKHQFGISKLLPQRKWVYVYNIYKGTNNVISETNVLTINSPANCQ